jgi:hypothetical protein
LKVRPADPLADIAR